jgi:hypothetical protein
MLADGSSDLVESDFRADAIPDVAAGLPFEATRHATLLKKT